VIPRQDAAIPAWKRAIFKYIPPVRWRYRADMMDVRESFHDGVTDRNTSSAALLVQMCQDMMKAQLPDKPELYVTKL